MFSVTGSSMGGSRAEDIDYVVFVDSRAYYEFPYKRKPDIAHIIGDINHHFRKSNQNLLLFVPGRIGTSSPELGVPVSFAAINHFCAICEMSDSEVGYMPELSYGSHRHMEIISIFDNDRINRIYENNLSELIRIGQYSIRNGMKIPRTNDNLKKMISYMRKGNYEKAFEILKNDHFGTGRNTALKMH